MHDHDVLQFTMLNLKSIKKIKDTHGKHARIDRQNGSIDPAEMSTL